MKLLSLILVLSFSTVALAKTPKLQAEVPPEEFEEQEQMDQATAKELNVMLEELESSKEIALETDKKPETKKNKR